MAPRDSSGRNGLPAKRSMRAMARGVVRYAADIHQAGQGRGIDLAGLLELLGGLLDAAEPHQGLPQRHADVGGCPGTSPAVRAGPFPPPGSCLPPPVRGPSPVAPARSADPLHPGFPVPRAPCPPRLLSNSISARPSATFFASAPFSSANFKKRRAMGNRALAIMRPASSR